MKDDEGLTDELKDKITQKVREDINDFEKNRVKRALAFLDDVTKLAPSFAKSCRALDEALQHEGFAPPASLAIIQELVKNRGLGI